LGLDFLHEFLSKVGNELGFDVKTEVEASESAFVDLVWFDRKLPLPKTKKPLHMRYAPVLPVVGFEIERHTGLNAKHVKGSVSNLNNLNAQLGVIVIGSGNLEYLKKKGPYQNLDEKQIKQILRERVYRWVYAEAQPRCRIIVMFESEVTAWWADGAPETGPSEKRNEALLIEATEMPDSLEHE
jgi:hypothetical protein